MRMAEYDELAPKLSVQAVDFYTTKGSDLPSRRTWAIKVRFHIIGNTRIKNVGKYQSCMVSSR